MSVYLKCCCFSNNIESSLPRAQIVCVCVYVCLCVYVCACAHRCTLLGMEPEHSTNELYFQSFFEKFETGFY